MRLKISDNKSNLSEYVRLSKVFRSSCTTAVIALLLNFYLQVNTSATLQKNQTAIASSTPHHHDRHPTKNQTTIAPSTPQHQDRHPTKNQTTIAHQHPKTSRSPLQKIKQRSPLQPQHHDRLSKK
ncbi:MAG: hypothetical protein ACKPCM_03255 [Pseudanabaena sp.]